MDSKIYDYWLYGLAGIGRRTFFKLRENGYFSKFLYECDGDKLPSILTEKQKNSILIGKKQDEGTLQRKYEKLKDSGIFMSVFGDADYPEKLYKISDPPAILFSKGNLVKCPQRSIAIIGARNCSEYGKYVAEEFAGFFARNHIAVISGMARGIDGFAQNAAVKSKGFSVGVLGNGVAVCYPAENYPLYQALIETGSVVSEYLPYEKPSPNFFPPRNRIISALADALLVVEAKEQSGTLITVEMALENGKEVYVVPGRVTDALSKGCNKLLWEGAYPALSPEKMLKDIYGEYCVAENEYKYKYKYKENSFSELQKQILAFLEITPVHINVLHQRTKLPLEVLQRELLLLSLSGEVKITMNSWYQKCSEYL